MNQSFSFQNVIEHPIIFPNMNYLSLNPAIKLQDIRENKGYTWDWFWLSGSYFNFDKDAFFLKKSQTVDGGIQNTTVVSRNKT